MISRNRWIVVLFLFEILLGGFRAEYLPRPAKDLVTHTYYVLSYNESCEEANWVYYVLTDSMVLNKGQERTNRFISDKAVPGGSATTSDYTKSGYDRGHLCPAADMGFNATAMSESFLMSNITPQTPDFNRGIWKELEGDVRDWAIKEHRLIVVAGPVFKDNLGTIGKDKVVVPGYFFKMILSVQGTPRMIAFLIPNAKTNRPLTDFAVPVDEIEKLTGYDFFSQLPDDQETQLESAVRLAGWFPGHDEPVAGTQSSEQGAERAASEKQFYLMVVCALLVVIALVVVKRKRK